MTKDVFPVDQKFHSQNVFGTALWFVIIENDNVLYLTLSRRVFLPFRPSHFFVGNNLNESLSRSRGLHTTHAVTTRGTSLPLYAVSCHAAKRADETALRTSHGTQRITYVRRSHVCVRVSPYMCVLIPPYYVKQRRFLSKWKIDEMMMMNDERWNMERSEKNV